MNEVPHPAPRVSIGLPVFNGENYLSETIDSILAQSYTNFELIISDNASTDGTGEICQEYVTRDSRVHYVRQAKNSGAAPNYNLLVERSRGELFKWAAHDDKLRPDFLSRCIDVLDAEPSAILAYPRTVVIGEAGEEIAEFRDGLALLDDTPDARLSTYLRRNFLRRKGLCNPIFGVIRIAGLRRTRMIQSFPGSDNVLLAHLSLLGKFVEVDEILFERRVHPKISTLAHRKLTDRTAWFDSSAKPKWGGAAIRNNYLSMRMIHLRNIYQAIGELLDNASERKRCRWHLTRLLALDPKWLYIDIKYSLGLQPKPGGIVSSLRQG